jgi:AcrR family transcriptional regulator
MSKAINNNDQERRQEITEAALYCFLHFGYAKTSMDDVAKKANLSRPLIYLKFKNKESLLIGIFEQLMNGRLEETEEIAGSSLSKKEKLLKIVEILTLSPWEKISGYPMSAEFYKSCDLMDPKTVQRFEKHQLKLVMGIFGDKTVAEVFILSLEGLMADLPSTNVLRKRADILVERFLSKT